jgi:hypothetical protein
MATAIRLTRKKISTTIAPSTMAYFEEMLAKGEAYNLAEAVDLLVERVRAAESRERLERETVAYFDNLSAEAQQEETELAVALSGATRGIDFDREP